MRGRCLFVILSGLMLDDDGRCQLCGGGGEIIGIGNGSDEVVC